MNKSNTPVLPISWKWVSLDEVTQKLSLTGKKIKQDNYLKTGDFPVIDQGEEKIGGYTNDLSNVIDGNPPFVIFGDHTKIVKYIDFTFAPGADGIKVLKPKKEIHPKLLAYFLKYASKKIPSKGYARHFQYLEKEKIPFPPKRFQVKIVEKIEELFSDLDNGIENLQKAKQQLETYKQSILKAAFEGKLTKEWREQQDDLPTPEELKTQIEEERKRYREQQLKEWEQEVKEWKEQGEPGRKPRKPRKPKNVESLEDQDIRDLKDLPTGWLWVRIGRIIQVSSGKNLTKAEMDDGQFPVYGGNGISGYHSDYLYKNEELIIGRVGAKCGVMHITKPKSWVTDNALVIDFLCQSIDMEYLKYRLEYENLNKLSSSSAQSVISGSKIYPVPISIPTDQEQITIVQEIESKLSVVEQLEKTIEEELQKAEALRQSILKKAFSGELVEG